MNLVYCWYFGVIVVFFRIVCTYSRSDPIGYNNNNEKTNDSGYPANRNVSIYSEIPSKLMPLSAVDKMMMMYCSIDKHLSNPVIIIVLIKHTLRYKPVTLKTPLKDLKTMPEIKLLR